MKLFKSMPLIVVKSCLGEVELACCMQKKQSNLKQLLTPRSLVLLRAVTQVAQTLTILASILSSASMFPTTL
jgi:hypothetical protein